jgi:hypothetical protein
MSDSETYEDGPVVGERPSKVFEPKPASPPPGKLTFSPEIESKIDYIRTHVDYDPELNLHSVEKPGIVTIFLPNDPHVREIKIDLSVTVQYAVVTKTYTATSHPPRVAPDQVINCATAEECASCVNMSMNAGLRTSEDSVPVASRYLVFSRKPSRLRSLITLDNLCNKLLKLCVFSTSTHTLFKQDPPAHRACWPS